MTTPPPPAVEEARLLERLRAGEGAALDMLIDLHHPMVYRAALRITGEHELAEEVTADTFVALYEHAASFRGEARLGTWLYRVASNRARNAVTSRIVRQARRTRSLDAPEGEEAGGEGEGPTMLERLSADGTDARRRAEDRRRLEALRRAVAELGESHREILELRFFEDLSYEEIAGRLEIGLGTVKSRLSRARHDLAERLRVEASDLFAEFLPDGEGATPAPGRRREAKR